MTIRVTMVSVGGEAGSAGGSRAGVEVDRTDLLGEVRVAITDGDWDRAVALLGSAPLEGSAEVLELTAVAAYGAGDLEGAVSAWEELHRLHLGDGDEVAAAFAAAMVAMYLMMDTGLMAPVRGWLGRAERLLRDVGETHVDAWLAMVRTYERLLSGDMHQAGAAAEVAVALGSRFGIPPAVAIGRVASARVEIFDGRIDDGLRLLDEVAVMLVSGELDALTTGMVYCELICAMQGLAQYDRAEQWTEAMERWRPGRAFGGINGRCRVHRAEILRLRGPFDAAEQEAVRACDELRPWMRREFGWPLTELGNIRLRKGDLAGAEEAFVAAHEHAWEPQPGLALLRLAQGDAAAASQLIRDALEHPLAIPSKERPPFGALPRAPLLDAEVEIALAVGDLARAQAAASELSAIAEDFRSEALRAAATLARGRVAQAEGSADDAVRECAAAVAGWTDIGAPYEAAVARTVLADAWRAAGNEEASRRERRAAEAALERLGACAPSSGSSTGAAGGRRSRQESESSFVFRCAGGLRTIVFDGATTHVRDLKGLRYLETLLAHPGKEFHVLDLVARERGDPAERPAEKLNGTYGRDAGPLLDGTARDAYRRRLRDVDEDIDEATRLNDDERRARAEADRDYLVQELARAYGLGG
ncbi:MAG: hypothetical protein ACRD0G_14410, partial [Acidimicrobiales bacterium]